MNFSVMLERNIQVQLTILATYIAHKILVR